MADLSIGAAFQMERAALIKEIARNIAGTPMEPGTATPSQAQLPTPTATGATAANGVSAPETAFLAEVIAAGDGGLQAEPGAGAATLLLGLKLPQAAASQQGALQFPPGTDAAVETALASLTLQPASGLDNGLQNAALAATSLPTEESAEAIIALLNGLPAGREEVATPLAFGDAPELTQTGVAQRPMAEARDAAATATGSSREAAPERGGAHAAAAAGAQGIAVAGDAATAHLRVVGGMEATESVVTRALLSLADPEMAALPRAMQGEMGGIVASFILNAHFQPGWPPLRPIQDPEAKALVVQLAKDTKLSKDDIAMLTYLANFGLNRKQLLRILKLVATATNRSKLLEMLAELFSTLSALLGTVKAELEALAEELRELRKEREARRERLTLR